MSAPKRPFFEVRRSRIQGRGAFALRRIRTGARIIEYTGEHISHAEADRRYDDDDVGRHHTFLFTLDRRTVVDAAVGGNDARFINHSCAPNCEAVIEDGHIYIEALRTIQPGEELAYDYNYDRPANATKKDEQRYPCRCGAPDCRGTIMAAPRKRRRRKSARRDTGTTRTRSGADARRAAR